MGEELGNYKFYLVDKDGNRQEFNGIQTVEIIDNSSYLPNMGFHNNGDWLTKMSLICKLDKRDSKPVRRFVNGLRRRVRSYKRAREKWRREQLKLNRA